MQLYDMGLSINCLGRQRSPGDWRRRGYINKEIINNYITNTI